jgi:hypothetical protein
MQNSQPISCEPVVFEPDSLFIPGLPSDIAQADVEAYFHELLGEYRDVFVPVSESGSRICLVQLCSAEAANYVLCLQRHVICGHEIAILRKRCRGAPPAQQKRIMPQQARGKQPVCWKHARGKKTKKDFKKELKDCEVLIFSQNHCQLTTESDRAEAAEALQTRHGLAACLQGTGRCVEKAWRCHQHTGAAVFSRSKVETNPTAVSVPAKNTSVAEEEEQGQHGQQDQSAKAAHALQSAKKSELGVGILLGKDGLTAWTKAGRLVYDQCGERVLGVRLIVPDFRGVDMGLHVVSALAPKREAEWEGFFNDLDACIALKQRGDLLVLGADFTGALLGTAKSSREGVPESVLDKITRYAHGEEVDVAYIRQGSNPRYWKPAKPTTPLQQPSLVQFSRPCGPYGDDTTNQLGNRLYAYLASRHLAAVGTFFVKKKTGFRASPSTAMLIMNSTPGPGGSEWKRVSDCDKTRLPLVHGDGALNMCREGKGLAVEEERSEEGGDDDSSSKTPLLENRIFEAKLEAKKADKREQKRKGKLRNEASVTVRCHLRMANSLKKGGARGSARHKMQQPRQSPEWFQEVGDKVNPLIQARNQAQKRLDQLKKDQLEKATSARPEAKRVVREAKAALQQIKKEIKGEVRRAKHTSDDPLAKEHVMKEKAKYLAKKGWRQFQDARGMFFYRHEVSGQSFYEAEREQVQLYGVGQVGRRDLAGTANGMQQGGTLASPAPAPLAPLAPASCAQCSSGNLPTRQDTDAQMYCMRCWEAFYGVGSFVTTSANDNQVPVQPWSTSAAAPQPTSLAVPSGIGGAGQTTAGALALSAPTATNWHPAAGYPGEGVW